MQVFLQQHGKGRCSRKAKCFEYRTVLEKTSKNQVLNNFQKYQENAPLVLQYKFSKKSVLKIT